MIDAQARAEDIGRRLVRHDDLGNRLARIGIQKAAVMIDLQRLGEEALLDVSGGHVLPIADALRQRQAGEVALGLSGDIEVDGLLQPPASAGNLRLAERRSQECAAKSQIQAYESAAFHQVLPLLSCFWSRPYRVGAPTYITQEIDRRRGRRCERPSRGQGALSADGNSIGIVQRGNHTHRADIAVGIRGEDAN